MKFQEILEIYADALEEATLTSVIGRINKYKAGAKSATDLSRSISDDRALKQSLPTVDIATAQEKAQYAELLKDPMVAQAINELPSTIKSSFNKLPDLPGPSKEGEKAEAKPDFLKQLDPQARKLLAQMQDEWFKAKDRAQKLALVGQWQKEPVKARLYKFGRDTLFDVPTAA